MKKLLLVGLLSLFCGKSFSQNLTVNQFLHLSEKDVGMVEEILKKNKWYFYLGADETKDKFANAKFVFDIPDYKRGPADYFITYYFSDNVDARAVEVIFINQIFYDSLMEQINNLKFQLDYSGTEDGNIIKIYKHKRDVIKVTIPPNFENFKTYKFQFMKKASYKKMQ